MLYTVSAPCSWQILHSQAIYFRIKLPLSMRAASRMRRRDSGSSKSSRRFGSSKKDMGRNLCRPGHLPQPLRRQPLRGLERLLPVAQIGIAPDRRTPPAENRWAVPWYSASGGSVTGSPTSTWMECPWLARISVRSSLKAYRCLLSLLTISSRMSRLMGYFLPMPAGSALTSAQPWASN